MDFDALIKRRNALYMSLRYWRMHERRNGSSEATTKKLEQFKAEFEVVRVAIRDYYKQEADVKKAARAAERAAKLAAEEEEQLAKEEEERKQKQIEENRKVSNQCRTTRNRPAKWRYAPTVFYDTSEPQKDWKPSFTVDLS